MAKTDLTVVIDYTNHRGERAPRRVLPLHWRYTTSEFHEGEQWFMEATDLDRGVDRMFALKSIHSWKPADGS